ncbi:DUF1345 domain-containing protein [Paludibacterium purpuratum]|uniref:Putative membrane protein n=1 Tax=Paludibacterium purpuratum TaxID=1144873 RepID=A0A4R7AZJ0_9NEIS|nr:DUF1345 domain-containing protein [Paludibacterium purpuratum]TDR73855.1 putative membrane protein [Paludibacterium purpuratum]
MKLTSLLRARPRLVLALLLALAVTLLLPVSTPPLDRTLLAWNSASWFYLLELWVLMLRATPERIRHIARIEDESAVMVLTAVSVAVVMSLLAIVLELASAKALHGGVRSGHLILAGSTLVAAWLLLPTMFALHYAHMFYGAREGARPLLFPDRPAMPDYWDFAYFAFTIAVASQTADIAPNNRAARRVVLAQSILAFVFNTSVLAMSINVAASLVS